MADVGAYTQGLWKSPRWHFGFLCCGVFGCLVTGFMIMYAFPTSKARWEEFYVVDVSYPGSEYRLMNATSCVVYKGPRVFQWIVKSLSCEI